MSGPAPCGSDIPSILELQLRKSVALTAHRKDESCAIRDVSFNQPDQDDEGEALKRLKQLVAETRQMADRAEALLASLRAPKDYYERSGLPTGR